MMMMASTMRAKGQLWFLVVCLTMVLAAGGNKDETRFLRGMGRSERRHHYAWSTEETTVAPSTTTTTAPSLAPTAAHPTFHPAPRRSFFKWSIVLPVVSIAILSLAVQKREWACFVVHDDDDAAFAEIPKEIQLTPVTSMDDELTVDYVGMAQ
jgi:hypothetical protein